MVHMKRKEKGPGKSGRGQALSPDPLRLADLLGEWPNLTPSPRFTQRVRGQGDKPLLPLALCAGLVSGDRRTPWVT